MDPKPVLCALLEPTLIKRLRGPCLLWTKADLVLLLYPHPSFHSMPPALPAPATCTHSPAAPSLPEAPQSLLKLSLSLNTSSLPTSFYLAAEFCQSCQAGINRREASGMGGDIRKREGPWHFPEASGGMRGGTRPPGFPLEPPSSGASPCLSGCDAEGRVNTGAHALVGPPALSSRPRPVLQTRSCVRRAGPSSRATVTATSLTGQPGWTPRASAGSSSHTSAASSPPRSRSLSTVSAVGP